MIYVLTWSAGGRDYSETFRYRHNAVQWIRIVRMLWGVVPKLDQRET